LTVQGLSVDYGRVRALDRVDIAVGAGEIVALIGANGAGKSTLLRTIAGLVRAVEGSIVYGNEELSDTPAYRRTRRGIHLVPEGRGILAHLTVRENLLLGATVRPNEASADARVRATLERFPQLARRKDLPAGALSGGEQQILAIARALLAKPQLLLIDEPSLGLAPRVTRDVFDLLVALRREGVTILLVEQNARAALAIADRAYALQNGRVVLSGGANELQNDARIQEAYLGATI
jgi:branched-chain amino acid transport system ATP-binding protein